MKKYLLVGVAVILGHTLARAAGLKITHYERSLQPGEVVLLTVESPRPLQDVEAVAFGKRFPFYSGSKPEVWHGLIGIDPESRAGRCRVRVLTTGVDGTSSQDDYLLEIKSKVFPTRRLSVDERYVTPPKEVEERIRAEARRVEGIFSAPTSRRLWQGPFIVPVPAPASSGFGRRTVFNEQPRSPHWGTDFDAGPGTPIKAPNSGRVVLASDLYFSGNAVIIDHGQGLYSYLAHMSEISVREGADVQTGEVVGKVGATGRVTGPHLHWSVRLSGIRVDPLSLVAALAGK